MNVHQLSLNMEIQINNHFMHGHWVQNLFIFP